MKKVFEILVFALIIIGLLILIEAISVLFYNHWGHNHIISVVFAFTRLILIFLLFAGTTYKILWNLNNFIKASFWLGFFLIISLVLSLRLHRMSNFYFAFKNQTRGLQGKIFQFDDKLAHKAIPFAEGAHTYHLSDSINGAVRIIIDSLGYRTTPEKKELEKDTFIDLYLGCSFTWGDYCLAENTYSYLVSKELHHNYLNAGCSAYGLAQMLQLAEELIPKYHFKYVFIQYSPWLANRAMSLYGPTFFGYRPFPYFYQENDKLKLQYPLFKSDMYDLPSESFKNETITLTDKLKFYLKIGIPVEIIDYAKKEYYSSLVKLEIYPKPTKDKSEVEKYVYNRIFDICEQYKCQPVIVKLGYGYTSALDSSLFKNHLGVVFVDTDMNLWKTADFNSKEFSKKYNHWYYTEQDTIFIDEHPNNFAHKIIAESILNDLHKNN